MNKRMNGEGSWGKKTINGKIYYFYRDPNRHYTYGRTKQEVREKISKLPIDIGISSRTTFGMYIQNWLVFKEGSVEQTTYTGYVNMINSMLLNFKHYDLANKPIYLLSPKVFQKYLNTLAKYYSRASIRKTWIVIKQCLKYGEAQNELPANLTYMVKVPLESAVAVKKKEIPFLNEKQADTFYNVLKIKTDSNFEKYKENRNAHALVLILYTGMRIGEALALKWKNVDLINKKIYIEESAAEIKVNGKYKLVDKCPKTAKSKRSIPLPNRAIEMIEYFKEVNKSTKPNDYVFMSSNNTRPDKKNIRRTLTTMCQDANLPKLSVHSLRHSYGSILLSKDVDIKIISETLGHSNISTTYDIYIGIKEDDRQSIIQDAFDN